MKKALTKVLLVALMAILPLSFYAQKKQTKPVEKYFYIFAEGGLSVNHTDLANYGFVPFYQDGQFLLNDGYVFNNFDGKLGLGYQFGKVMGVNAKFGTATLAGEKHGQQLTTFDAVVDPTMANKGFEDAMLDKTTFMEANLNLTFNLTNLFFGYNPRRVFNFIPHVGIGGIRYHAGAVTSTTGAEAPNIAAKEDAEMTFTVPVGAELNFNLARKLDLYIDYTFTWAGNDKLDQVQKLPDDIQVVNDMYSSVNLGLRFKFNSKPTDIEGMAARSNEIEITTDPEELRQKGEDVCFNVIFKFPPEYFEKKAVMNITPTFYYAGGSMELEPVTFVGEDVAGENKVSYANGAEIVKEYCVKYVDELEHAKLKGSPMIYVYNGNIYDTQEEIMDNVSYFTRGGDRLINQNVTPEPKCYVEPGSVKMIVNGYDIKVVWDGNAPSYDVYLSDAQGNYDETPTATRSEKFAEFPGRELGSYKAKVVAVCDANSGMGDDSEDNEDTGDVKAPKRLIAVFYFDYESATLKSSNNKIGLKDLAEQLAAGLTSDEIEILGYASPENGDANNDKLSADRAAAIEKLIKDQMKKVKVDAKNYNFATSGEGSDWTTFMDLLDKSTLADKDQMKSVINNARTDSQKETEIQMLKKRYPELDRKVLSQIRRVEVYVK